ncbi:DNA mismatch repair endonuclease MutL [Robiginitalea sp. IMCC43444]|uniref:DNA mismatch repair endonuclease MutL n=1 Tax=Robiginitalea sp. IMCC43444 TaxID=3459121 RepID=UPI004042B032
MMADSIQILPEHVANQIAAGEVVQRPASVVKELLENAIDAGASSIELIIRDGGKTLVHIADDGCGMSPADARMSFERHATSKIRKATDLFDLHTKGFRGEALASIAAIAQVEMTTRTAEAETGIRLKIAGGKQLSEEEAVAPAGTSIQVKNLFFNIPARRNFLKSDRVELRHVLDEFHRVALAHPGIRFKMLHNDQELFNLPDSPLRKRLGYLFGDRMNSRLVPVREETQIAAIGGFVCKPEFAKKSRGEQFFFVNNRFIKSSYLHHAVMAAYEGLLKTDTYPGYFIFLDVPPESIDINIHPSKTEIKFEDEQSLYAILRAAIKHSLGQFNIHPVLDFEKDQNLETPYAYRNKGAEIPQITVDKSFNPFAGETGGVKKYTKARASASHWEALYEGLNTAEQTGKDSSEWVVESEERPRDLFEETADSSTSESSSFQLGRKYILTRVKSGLLLIDQHRAHQRVLYEGFLENITSAKPASQVLLFPLKLSFSPAEMSILKTIRGPLEGMGFQFGEDMDAEFEVRALPFLIKEQEVPELLDSLIAQWQKNEDTAAFSQGDRIAKSLCQALAIKPGVVLDQVSQMALINDLFGCKESALSPFNKRIHTTLSMEELENKLK